MVFVTKFDFLKWGKENDLPLNKIDYQFIFQGKNGEKEENFGMRAF
jgi:hypothetical protein